MSMEQTFEKSGEAVREKWDLNFYKSYALRTNAANYKSITLRRYMFQNNEGGNKLFL